MKKKKKWKEGKMRGGVAVGVRREQKPRKKKWERKNLGGVPQPVYMGVGGGKMEKEKKNHRKKGTSHLL